MLVIHRIRFVCVLFLETLCRWELGALDRKSFILLARKGVALRCVGRTGGRFVLVRTFGGLVRFGSLLVRSFVRAASGWRLEVDCFGLIFSRLRRVFRRFGRGAGAWDLQLGI